MPPFVLLEDTCSYRPCPRDDMLTDQRYREYWLEHFETHFDYIVQQAIDTYGPQRAGDAHTCRDELAKELHAIRADPARYGELDLLVLDLVRQQKLLAYGLPDPFARAKQRENDAMLKLYPQIVAELDSHHEEGAARALLLLVEGVFAGNIFDLGVTVTAERFRTESPDFVQIRDDLGGKRPWLVDHYDAFAEKMLAPPAYKKAIFFLDNAGSDCILGVLPLVRWMAQRGTEVVCAANRLPALNDVTHHELREVLRRIGMIDKTMAEFLRKDRITVVESGGVAPLLDLRHVSAALNEAAPGADVIFLEGMGRGVMSNFDATFKVDAVKLCMLKDPLTAERIGGKMFDVVLRFDPAAPGPR